MIKVIDKFEKIDHRHESVYIKDKNISYHVFVDSIHITDLKNALRPGEICNQYSIVLNNRFNHNIFCDFSNSLITLNLSEINFLTALLNNKFNNYKNDLIEITKRELKAINVFTPFKEIKPIKIPKKWTISHVWKGILSGQILDITKELHLTDDYAFDADDNFGKGNKISNYEMAKDLIENRSGYWIRVEKETDKFIKLSINCHHFDYNSAIFRK